jgi:hypothetical protein
VDEAEAEGEGEGEVEVEVEVEAEAVEANDRRGQLTRRYRKTTTSTKSTTMNWVSSAKKNEMTSGLP